MHRTHIYLADEQTSAMDRLAEQMGVSRAEVVRRPIDRGLSGGFAGDAPNAIAEQGRRGRR